MADQPLRSLFDVQGLEGLSRTCEKFKVRLTAFGGMVRTLAQHVWTGLPLKDYSIFRSSHFMSDFDLLHSGEETLTPLILESIHETVPGAECLRWELRSEKANRIYSEATIVNNIIPVNLMSLSTHGWEGIIDPWNGRRDIEKRDYRFIRNGFYQQSPLDRAGRDLEIFSALLYLRVLLEADITPPGIRTMQPGFETARDVIQESIGKLPVIARLQESAYLRSRFIYLRKSLLASARSYDEFSTLISESGLQQWDDRLKELAPDLAATLSVLPQTSSDCLVASARLGGTLFRLDHTTAQWMSGQSAQEELWNALKGWDKAQFTPNTPAELGPGQSVLLASPPLLLREGISESSVNAPSPLDLDPMASGGTREFAHFLFSLDGQQSQEIRSYDSSRMAAVLSVILDKGEQPPCLLFPLPSLVQFRSFYDSRDADRTLQLSIRINCLGLLEHAADLYSKATPNTDCSPQIQIFILGWHGLA